MVTEERIRTSGRVGLLLGVSLAGALVLSNTVPRGNGMLGADLTVTAFPSGELDVSPAGVFLRADDLRPGASETGSVTVQNQTGTRLGVRLHALPSSTELDGVVAIAVDVDHQRLFAGNLGALRAWTERSFVMNPGERCALTVSMWIPRSAGDSYTARIEDVALEFRATAEG